MGTEKFKCPRCGHKTETKADEYLYGSPFRECPKCKYGYVDIRYHEIAVEGIREEDINPTKEMIRENKKNGWKYLFLGIGAIVLFILIIFTGWIVFPLPVIGIIWIMNGIGNLKYNSTEYLQKRRVELAIEKQDSEMRLKDPQYVEQLRSIGYKVPKDINEGLK